MRRSGRASPRIWACDRACAGRISAMLVGCGAGGAIAAAFGAPLTGAFYAFELIIGAYSLANAIPVFAATLAASLTTQAIIGAPYDITAPTVAPLTFVDYGALIGLGLVAAAVGVGAMRVAALIERASAGRSRGVSFALSSAESWSARWRSTARKCWGRATARSGSTSIGR